MGLGGEGERGRGGCRDEGSRTFHGPGSFRHGGTVSARSVARPGIRHGHGLVLGVFDHGGTDQAETEQVSGDEQ
ncbi:hypothetical protein GCM10017687_10270 [Streptomyces echinatus]